jgi:hypothetical protein
LSKQSKSCAKPKQKKVHPKDESENAKMQESMDGGESDQLKKMLQCYDKF